VQPATLSTAIFTQAELNNILTMILNNMNLWDVEVSMPQGIMAVFGAPLYRNNYDSDVTMRKGQKTRELLQKTVPYHKLGDFELGANPPGFHIFANTCGTTETVQVNNIHTDEFPAGMSESYVVPIFLPKVPCGVDYMVGESMHRFNYEVNHLYHWQGEMLHTISEMTLDPREMRVTLQGHVINNTLFW
jgi:hypothetical protein